ncbi:hypothetical protein [Flindersiella endophytica]
MTQEWEERAAQDQNGEPGLEEPDADAAEQRRPLSNAEEPESPDEPLPEEADEADVLDQRRIVPAEDEDYTP